MRPQEFIPMLAQAAQEFQIQSGVYTSVTLAQAALETGWGQFIPIDKHTGKNSYNLFGVKGYGPAGTVVCDTWEVYGGVRQTIQTNFRAYHTYYESLADHGDVLTLDRYASVRNAPTAEEAAMQLHPCGYATDPSYGEKLVSIIRQYDLTTYDFSKGDISMIKELQERVQKLESIISSYQDQSVSDWAKPSFEKAIAKGVIKGDGQHFSPKAPITREQMVAVLDRMGLL